MNHARARGQGSMAQVDIENLIACTHVIVVCNSQYPMSKINGSRQEFMRKPPDKMSGAQAILVCSDRPICQNP